MTTTYRVDREAGLIVVTHHGEVSMAEARVSSEEIMRDPAALAEYAVLILVNGARLDFTYEELLAHAKWRKQSRKTPRMAIVAAGDLEFGVARMYQIATDSAASANLRIFRDEAEARAWLGGTQA